MREDTISMMYTYNILYILARKVEVGDYPQVFLWGQALFPFHLASRLSDQLCGQTDHDGSDHCLDLKQKCTWTERQTKIQAHPQVLF